MLRIGLDLDCLYVEGARQVSLFNADTDADADAGYDVCEAGKY